jgi:hypothetical protein
MTATAEDDSAPRWQDDLYALLRANDVTQFAYVPDPPAPASSAP